MRRKGKIEGCGCFPSGQEGYTRRDFLSWAWWTSAGVLGLLVTLASIASLWPRVKAGAFGTRLTAGKVGDFPLGSMTYFPDARFYLVHLPLAGGGSGFLALYRRCTHLGCVVPWRADEPSEDDIAKTGRFNCPCHASIFDRRGLVRGGPAPRPLDLFPVAIEKGEVLVDTGKIVQRSGFDEAQVARL